MLKLLVLALLCAPGACLSQQTEKRISPGMTEAQVVQSLGRPATKRTVGERTYLFYPNTCGRRCGMNDLVVLNRDTVVDAIFRSPDRHYSGTSSSPESVPPRKPSRAKPATTPAPLKPPARPNDATPSIPAKPPTMKPATGSPAPAAAP